MLGTLIRGTTPRSRLPRSKVGELRHRWSTWLCVGIVLIAVAVTAWEVFVHLTSQPGSSATAAGLQFTASGSKPVSSHRLYQLRQNSAVDASSSSLSSASSLLASTDDPEGASFASVQETALTPAIPPLLVSPAELEAELLSDRDAWERRFFVVIPQSARGSWWEAWNVRHEMFLNSLFLHHPDAKVYFVAVTPDDHVPRLRMLESYVRMGYSVRGAHLPVAAMPTSGWWHNEVRDGVAASFMRWCDFDTRC